MNHSLVLKTNYINTRKDARTTDVRVNEADDDDGTGAGATILCEDGDGVGTSGDGVGTSVGGGDVGRGKAIVALSRLALRITDRAFSKPCSCSRSYCAGIR